MYFRIALLLLAALSIPSLNGQTTISGLVLAEGSNEALVGANVYWSGTTIGTTAGYDGGFTIQLPPRWPARLVTSFVGYRTDTLLLKEPPKAPLKIPLRWAVDMGPVEVVERVSGTQLSTRTVLRSQ
jgi:hypothetical protein